ncbi:MAG: aminoglycoside phosphotransferase family protein [Streptococcus gallolyticus]|nr:aminoglycoside phosphotransferase family protein [Streptococcus gallolyticus]
MQENFTGHSGCNVRLIKDGSRYFVRKTSASENYNSRLEKQMRKQARFQDDCLNAPVVIRNGYENGLFFFDMEYIKGETAVEYLRKHSPNYTEKFVHKLIESVFEKEAIKDVRVDSVFKDKIMALRNTIHEDNDVIRRAFDVLDSTDWSGVKKSQCHGDLTLENIIVRDNGDVYLLDFLDSFYDSYIIDAGKMLQDAIGKWSFRDDCGLADTHTIYKRAVIEEMQNKKEMDIAMRVALLHLLRIIPYSHTVQDRDFVINSIKMNLELL